MTSALTRMSHAAEDATDRLWAEYLAEDEGLVAQWESRPQSETTVLAELSWRAERDQLVRQLMFKALKTDGAKPGDAPFWWLRLKGRMDKIDEDNQAWLEQHLDDTGWFTRSEYGEDAEKNAFLIVQHADGNIALQKRVLAMYESLLPKQEVLPEHYAELRDRVTAAENDVQRYGTQLECESGELRLKAPLEDPDKVDQWRAEVGLPSLEDYMSSASEEVGDCAALTGN